MVTDGNAQPQDFKFFFNYLSWPPGELKVEASIYAFIVQSEGVRSRDPVQC